jgi:hypothetical protein
MNTETKKQPLQPIPRANFGAAAHRFNVWDAEVSEDLSRKDLTNDILWVNMAPSLRVGDEIRVRAADGSFIGLLYVSFKHGNQVVTHLLWLAHPEAHKGEGEFNTDQIGDYTVKQRGQEGWCLIQVSTGHVIGSKLGNKSDALKALEQHIRALAA